MIDQLEPGDRVLLLAVPEAQQLRDLSAHLTLGVCVVMGPEEAIRSLRKDCADLDNVMLIFDPEDGTIPWQEGFFTVASGAGNADLPRVLAPGARVLASE